MKWFYRFERRFGRYAIRNLMWYIIILYAAGVVLDLVAPSFYTNYLSLNVYAILHGQIWRIVTFLIKPPSSSLLFSLIALYCYYLLGTTLERTWGAFRFNLYYFVGVLGTILAAFVIYAITGRSYLLGTTYINLSLFFGVAISYPDTQFLFMYIIPIKAKWLAVIEAVVYVWLFISGGLVTRVEIGLSLINVLVFFFVTRDYARWNPNHMKRRVEFQRVSRAQQNRQNSSAPRHKCAVCGRTEKDGADLVFRYCSKCDGNYEYCQDHLYTHEHVKIRGYQK